MRFLGFAASERGGGPAYVFWCVETYQLETYRVNLVLVAGINQSFLAFKNGHDSDNWDEIRLSRSWRAASASIGYFCGHRRTNSIRGQAAHNARLSRKYGEKMGSCRTPLGGHLARRRAYFLC